MRDRHERLDALLRSLAERCRPEVKDVAVPLSSGSPLELVRGLADARVNLEACRVAERRRDRLELRLKGFRDHLVPRVYPGLWARINAFLDLQALSVANVAGEEFRKAPRPLTGLVARRESELEAD